MKKIVCALAMSLIISTFAGAAIQEVQVSNNTSAAVTVSWITDSDTVGEVNYSANPNFSDPLTVYDTRGQSFRGSTHYVEIKNLAKETTYYFEVVSGSEIDNNNGNYYTFKTMKEPFTPPGICLLYGNVYQADGATAAEGAIVHLWLTHGGVDSYLLSKLIDSKGSFLINIKEVRSTDTDDLFSSIATGDPIHLKALYDVNHSADKNVVFEGCTRNCGSIVLADSSAITTTTTTSTPSPTTSPATTPTTSPPVTPTTIPDPPPPTTTAFATSSTTTTVVESTTSSTISTSTTAVESTSSTTSTLSTSTTILSLLWPVEYEELWGVDKERKLSLLRSFRDEVITNDDLGREYLFLLYSNSIEVLTLLMQYPSLLAEVGRVIDELLPAVQARLEGKKMGLAREQATQIQATQIQATQIESLLNHLEVKASPQLKKAIKKVRGDLKEGLVFKRFRIAVHK